MNCRTQTAQATEYALGAGTVRAAAWRVDLFFICLTTIRDA
jgi:hypothetical protein